ncbi:glycosyltransferase [Chelativorans sp. AA-79]|uniref:glycosyltransferase n=1 Tax=Chelativorans sp. AA-79 TaxID=3028735 RepID=UPI0023F98046|nr:glycosyltransferase [Chelativorans sp. AA-79]WEX10237.1 glycosyltransferase [Chelativorans sp. AA-79]
MKTILFVNVHFSPYLTGGGSIVAEHIAKGIEKSAQVILFSVRYGDAISLEEHTISDNIVSIVMTISKPSSYVSYHRNSIVAECVVRVCQKYSPDFVHFHSIQTMGIEMVQSVKNLGIQCIVTVHDNWWLCERQFLWHEDQVFCGQLKRIDQATCLYCTANAFDMTARSEILKGVYTSFDAVVHVSNYMRDLYENSGMIGNNVHVIENGVDVPRPVKPAPWKQTGIVYLGYLGGDAAHKGIDIVIDIAVRAPANCRFLVVSNMNGKYQLDSILDNGFGDNRIEFIKSMEHSRIEEFYDIVDVIIAPSRVPESYGLVVREALIRDKWVLTSSGGAQADAVIDGVNGNKFDTFAVDMETAHSHVSTISTVDWSAYSNPHKDSIPTWETQVGKYIDLYASI